MSAENVVSLNNEYYLMYNAIKEITNSLQRIEQRLDQIEDKLDVVAEYIQ